MSEPPWGPPTDWNRSPNPWTQSRAWSGQDAPWGTPQGSPWGPPQGSPWGQQQGSPWGAPQGNPWGQQQASQYYYQPGSYPPPPPPRRRGSFGTLLRAIVAIAIIMFISSVVRSVLDGVLDVPTTTTTPTATRTQTATSTTRPTTGTSATAAPTASGSPTSGTGPSGYQNEGYQAPPADLNPPNLPVAQTEAEARTWLTANDLYSQSVPSPTRCTMTPITGNNTTTQLEAKLNAEMACLMAVWEPPVTAAGYVMPRPPVRVYTTSVTTACGVMKEVNASYCAGDQRVYYAKSLLQELPSQVGGTKYAAETVIAHEFGHAVQARTGLLLAEKALEQQASKNDALVLSRRAEQQADCFAGLYIASVARSQGLTTSDLDALVRMTYQLGDDVLSGNPNVNESHGSGQNRQAWFTKGVQTAQIGACNTWVVPATQVR